MVLGLVVCLLPKAFALDTAVEFTQHPNKYWFLVSLPEFAWPWDNDGDGARGDKRGWYWTLYWSPIVLPSKVQEWLINFGIVPPIFYLPDCFKYYWWLAIRNPANNFKRFIMGFDIRTATIVTLLGQDFVRDDFRSTGWQLVKAGNRYHFYLVYRYGDSNNALVIELGNKFRVEHNGQEYEREHKYFKGFTFEINPYKDIS